MEQGVRPDGATKETVQGKYHTHWLYSKWGASGSEGWLKACSCCKFRVSGPLVGLLVVQGKKNQRYSIQKCHKKQVKIAGLVGVVGAEICLN